MPTQEELEAAQRAADWVFLRDGLRSLDNKVVNETVVSGPPWDLPANLTGPAAYDYLEAASVRLEEVARAVERALESPLERVKNAGKDVQSLNRALAEKALGLAKHLAHASAESFERTMEKMAKGGEELAKGLGMGAVLVAVVLFLMFRNSRG